jgi:putative acetyltransferase
MLIQVDDLAGTQIRALLDEHLRGMHALSPPESVHALDLEALRKPDITFWTAWSEGELLGCGALKALDSTHGEVKSMRTASTRRRTGVGRTMLEHIIAEARTRSYGRLSLETGSMEAFAPARRLYENFGFTYCGPFADYTADPHSVFMTRTFGPASAVFSTTTLSSSVKLDVFGKLMLIERVDGAWRTWLLGSDGKRSLVHIAVPDTISESGLVQYFDDIYHEVATPERPAVLRLP